MNKHDDAARLLDAWRMRNAAAVTVGLAEDRMRDVIRSASIDELVALIETFSPASSSGPEWTRTFEPLVERLWTWCSNETMAALADAFAKRGMPWMAVTTALQPKEGGRIRGELRRPSWARLPAFTTL